MRSPRSLSILRLLAGLAAWTALPSCLSHSMRAERPRELARRIGEVMARPELRSSTFGIEVRRLADGSLIYHEGAERLLAPASTTKIVSCGGALALLGPDFRFETRVVRTGELKGGVLEGDLVLIGSGDPNLSQRAGADGKLLFTNNDHTYAGFLSDATVVPGDPLGPLADLAQQVKRAGIERVEGAVVVDDGLFQERSDEFVGSFSAACVNDNVIDVLVTPAASEGQPPSAAVQPVHRELVVENLARTRAASSRPAEEEELKLEYKSGVARFELSGTVPLGSRPVLCVGKFPRPALAAAHLFAGELEKRGVALRDPPREAAQGPAGYAGRELVARHTSPPFSEAIKVILKVSHNLHATMLPVLVGALKGGSGDRTSGYRLIHDLFRKAGVEVDGVVLSSGSGGGRGDCLSARFMVSLLSHLATREEFPAFYAGLPVGGVDGTLAGHFRSPALRGRVHAKTGTLVYPGAFNSGYVYVSKALAGYLDPGPQAASGLRPAPDALVFTILIANTFARSRPEGTAALFAAQEDILKALIDLYGGRPAEPRVAEAARASSPETQAAFTSTR